MHVPLSFVLPSLSPFYRLLCSLLPSMKLWLHIWSRVVVRPRNCWFFNCVQVAVSIQRAAFSSNRPCSPLGCRPARLSAAALLASWIPSCLPRRGRWFRWKIKIRCFDSAPRRRRWSRCPRRQLPPRGSARLAGEGVLAWPGRECSLGRGGSARLDGKGVLAWPGRECSLGRGGSARLAGEGVLAWPGRECSLGR